MLYTNLDWSFGRLLLLSNGEALCGLYFEDGRDLVRPGANWRCDPAAKPFRRVQEQLEEYATGERQAFDVPLQMDGTTFQQRVWRAIAGVPFGATISYLELARRSATSTSSRAAGMATGRNPISIIVPCHRIVGSNGSLTGYGGGLDRKRALLDFEAAVSRGVRGESWIKSPKSLLDISH